MREEGQPGKLREILYPSPHAHKQVYTCEYTIKTYTKKTKIKIHIYLVNTPSIKINTASKVLNL